MATGTQEITQQRLDKRLTGHTDECLFCGSNGLSFGSFETQDSTIYQEVECGDCGALWSDAYELQRVVYDGDGHYSTQEQKLDKLLAAARDLAGEGVSHA